MAPEVTLLIKPRKDPENITFCIPTFTCTDYQDLPRFNSRRPLKSFQNRAERFVHERIVHELGHLNQAVRILDLPWRPLQTLLAATKVD